MQNSISYQDAGVNIENGDLLVENIKPLAKRTQIPGVLAGIGGFGALFELGKGYTNPVLVSGTDGVGTKLKLAFELNRHNTIGIDLVAMSVNDILVQGAKPLFFLDYYACGKLDIATATQVISGITQGCLDAGCALIGGETAEMPGMYVPNEYDLAGFAVGIVEKDQIIDGSSITSGDVIVGLSSSGFHSNGYSLVRKIIETSKLDLNSKCDHKQTFADALLAPTQIYVKPILELMNKITIKGMSHITGGGITGNLPRVFPNGVGAQINLNSYPLPEIFKWAQEHANLSDEQMLETFNCGIGFAVIVDKKDADTVINHFKQHNTNAYLIGEIISSTQKTVVYNK